MMNKQKLKWALALIILTITAIAAFQTFWLKGQYDDTFNTLKKETDILFREAVYKIQMQKFRRDTTLYGSTIPANLFMFEAMNSMLRTKDTLSKRIIIKKNDNRSISLDLSPKDSVRLLLKDSFKFIGLKEGGDIKLQFAVNDSLSIREIDSSYKKELLKSGIDIPYTISSKKIIRQAFSGPKQPMIDSFPNKLITGDVGVGFTNRVGYRANFSNPHNYIIQQLTFPFIFSLALLSITIVSFTFLYKNLAAQSRIAAMKNEFVSNMTHELKTPIATVNVAIEAMRNFNVLQTPEKAKEYLDITAGEMQRLSMLVDKVLKYSMFENKKIDLNIEDIDLKQLCTEVIKSMRLQLEKSNLQLTVNEDGNKNYFIKGDRLHLQSLLYNLIDNAIKYNHPKGKITISFKKENNKIIVSIADTGIGISEEYKNRIFDKFFRVPQGNVHNVKGYGLGLSYVYAVMQQHKAQINVDSKPNNGSIFTLQFDA